MKPLKHFMDEFETGKEYSRDDVKEILEHFQKHHKTIESFIEYAERIFLMTGEMCGYDASSLCNHKKEE